MTTTVGYASSAAVPLHFGLAAATMAPRIEIRWPSGGSQTLTDVKADQVVEVSEK
jgi:hypothetical protein